MAVPAQLGRGEDETEMNRAEAAHRTEGNLMPVLYHDGRFPPGKLGWPRLLPLWGPFLGV